MGKKTETPLTGAIFLLVAGGYYTIELHNRRLRLVALNTNLYLNDVDPDGELHDVDIEASWVWLERTMMEARRKGQNVSQTNCYYLRARA